MTTPKSLATLLRVKRRRIEQLEAQVQECLRALKACEDEQAQAAQAHRQCQQAEDECAGKIDTLSSRAEGFLAADLVTLGHVLDSLRTRTRQALQQLEQATQRVAAARQQLLEARQAVQRALKQIELIEAQRETLLLAARQAQDDLQDEESEEAAVARLLAAGRDEAQASRLETCHA